MEPRMSYVYGSTAPKLSPDSEREVLRRKNRKSARAAVHSYEHIPKARLIFCLIALTSMCFVMLYRFSILADLNATMNRLNEEYEALRNENRLLKVEIETSIDLDRVKEIAETRLGMHQPDRYQIVAVSVPKNNYNVVLNQDYIEETAGSKDKPLLEGILDAIKAALP
jgi:Cell division protein FtsL.